MIAAPVLHYGKSEEGLHVDDEIRHKDLTRNAVDQDKAECQIKRRIFFDHPRLEAVEDVPEVTAPLKRRVVL